MSFVLSLPFLVKVNLNHNYNIEKFLWKKMRHITAHWVFIVSEKRVLKSVLHINNLTITEYFIELINLVADMKEYIMHMNSLQYNNKYDNIYDILPSEYHEFVNVFKAAEKQLLSEKDSHDHSIDLKLSQQPLFRKLYSMFLTELMCWRHIWMTLWRQTLFINQYHLQLHLLCLFWSQTAVYS